jgi:hypothetical protein
LLNPVMAMASHLAGWIMGGYFWMKTNSKRASEGEAKRLKGVTKTRLRDKHEERMIISLSAKREHTMFTLLVELAV